MFVEFDKNKKFKDYPIDTQENIFFIFKYFTTIQSNNKEYHFIPKELLEDKYFVFDCLKINPDIYLLADKVHCQEFFNILKQYHPNTYLKYASEKQLSDKQFCLDSIKKAPYNYEYAPIELKLDKILVQSVFENLAYPKELAKTIPKKIINDDDFMYSLLRKNPNIFYGISNKIKPTKELYKMLVFKDSQTFKYFNEEFKKDKSFLEDIIKEKEYKESIYNYDYTRGFSFDNILENIGTNMFSEEFCQKYANNIIDCYGKLSKDIRGLDNIIKILFDDNIPIKNGTKSNTTESSFVSKIPIKSLVDELNIPRKEKIHLTDEEIRRRSKVIVDKYFLNKELTVDSSRKEKVSIKIKI